MPFPSVPPTTFSDWTRSSFQTYPTQQSYHSPASPLPLRRHHYIVPNRPPPPPPSPAPVKRRSSSKRSRISRGTRLEALWEVSEEEESATDSSSSSSGRNSRRKPRPMGITRAADLSPQGSFRIPSAGCGCRLIINKASGINVNGTFQPAVFNHHSIVSPKTHQMPVTNAPRSAPPPQSAKECMPQ